MSERKRIKADALKAYDVKRWTLIPLHLYDAVSTIKRKGKTLERRDGKRPQHFNWTTQPYSSAKVLARCLEQNRNIGVRLKPDQLVIDVDPRNGGDKSWKELCADLGLDASAFPCVVTGSGGLHLYMSKPDDVPVVDTLEDYPGVEFKSKGRQVVAAGSIHPDTLKHYDWDALGSVALDDLPPAPRKLLNLIRRPERTNAVAGGGQYTQEQLAVALAKLDPTDFRDHAKWLRLKMACHHATNGDGRHEFIEWSVSDPEFADHAEVIGRRWDSLHKDKMDGITYRTLNHILREHDAADAQVADVEGARDDFADDAEEEAEAALDFADDDDADDALSLGDDDDDSEGPDEAEQPSALESLNDKYTWVIEGGKPRIIYADFDPVMSRTTWERMSPQDFQLHYSNRTIERAKKQGQKAPETIKLGKAWVEWPRRREARGVIFDPERTPEGYLNLWTGFAITPRKTGEWTWLRELIHEVLASGEDEISTYILNWLAYLIQHPAHQAEVALVFRGGKGVGKGTLGNALCAGIGRHALAIASASQITGRFNSHLQDCIFLFADEALKPYDKEAESRLKAMITEPVLTWEGKGRDVISGPNFLHILMASNEGWVVPAGMDERRFLVTDCNTKWQGHESRWAKLRAQLYGNDNAGLKRFFFDLFDRDISGFHPRRVPTTDALIDQKERSSSPLVSYFRNALDEGFTSFEVFNGEWESGPVRFFYEAFRDDFHAYCVNNRINPNGNGRGAARFLLQELKQLFPNANTELRSKVPEGSMVRASPSDGRAQAIELPSLLACRAAYEKKIGGKIKWPRVAESEFG